MAAEDGTVIESRRLVTIVFITTITATAVTTIIIIAETGTATCATTVTEITIDPTEEEEVQEDPTASPLPRLHRPETTWIIEPIRSRIILRSKKTPLAKTSPMVLLLAARTKSTVDLIRLLDLPRWHPRRRRRMTATIGDDEGAAGNDMDAVAKATIVRRTTMGILIAAAGVDTVTTAVASERTEIERRRIIRIESEIGIIARSVVAAAAVGLGVGIDAVSAIGRQVPVLPEVDTRIDRLIE